LLSNYELSHTFIHVQDCLWKNTLGPEFLLSKTLQRNPNKTHYTNVQPHFHGIKIEPLTTAVFSKAMLGVN